MKVSELPDYMKYKGKDLTEQILAERYVPTPVKRVETPKPDGGTREFGIPTVIDRLRQQAISQKLSLYFKDIFLENSFGFSIKRSAHYAAIKAKSYINSGYTWVVDIDLAKYFDTANHDKLMFLLSEHIKDKRVLRLIRKYLNSGVMINAIVVETYMGCPQGGLLSPLLSSNIMPHKLDKEIMKRGHKLCRYADDSNVFVRSKRAGERGLRGITFYLETRLKLKVTQNKSAVDRPWNRKFLGFSFYTDSEGSMICVHSKSIIKLENKIRDITSRSNAMSEEQRISRLNSLIRGWVNYFKIANMKSLLSSKPGNMSTQEKGIGEYLTALFYRRVLQTDTLKIWDYFLFSVFCKLSITLTNRRIPNGYLRWCERSAIQLKNCLLLDYKFSDLMNYLECT